METGLIAPGIMFLGDQGVMTADCGLKIAYLSSIEQQGSYFGFSKENVDELIKSASEVKIDMLFTSQWPEGIKIHAKESKNESSAINFESKLVGNLVKGVKPRYHFAGFRSLDYETLAKKSFVPIESPGSRPTKFIGLAPIGNEEQLKNFYAFKMKSSVQDSTGEGSSTGTKRALPYQNINPLKRFKPLEGTSPTERKPVQYFFDMGPSTSTEKRPGSALSKYGESSKSQANEEVNPSGCWFCLQNDVADKHLVINVGENVYLALAKGCLVTDHVIIVPISHIPSLVSLPKQVEDEMEKYKHALANFFFDQQKAVIFFERYVPTMHSSLQVAPIENIRGYGVKSALFEVAAENHVHVEEISRHSSIKEVIQPNQPYFYLEVRVDKIPIFKAVSKERIPVKFPRTLMVHPEVLELPRLVIDWRRCGYTIIEEVSWVEQFRSEFRRYAP
ncbi:CWF19-like protein 1 [Stegodyphus dumicola]|uniref:CWF19-like protein 1 n=1 Tax=Stegodyphus dumicola TaxID=202533 RepID=UPI0015A98652|nr:CWF19-like protein 1 [Stegodyphus dumicola]